MKTIYNNYDFQESHVFDKKIITSEIKGLDHNSKIIKSKIRDLNYCKKTFALAGWIREWRKSRDKNSSIDVCVKFV